MKNGVFLVCIGSILVGNAHAMELEIENDDWIKRAFHYQSVSGKLFKAMEIIPDNVEAMQKTLNDMESLETKLMFVAKMLFEQKEVSLEKKVDLIESLSATKTVEFYKHEKKQFADWIHFLNKYIVHKKSSIQKEKEKFWVNTLVKRFSPIKRTFVGAAVFDNQPDILALLCAIGANLSTPDDKGKLPISYAIKNPKRIYMIPLLMRFGSGVYCDNVLNKSKTWLIHAIKKEKISAVEKIIERCSQADLNIQDMYGKTAMHYAASRGLEVVIQKLYEHGASVTIKDKLDETALFKAIKRAQVSGIKQLLNSFKNLEEKKEYIREKNILGVDSVSLASVLGLKEVVVSQSKCGEDVKGRSQLNLSKKSKKIPHFFSKKRSQTQEHVLESLKDPKKNNMLTRSQSYPSW